MKGINPLAVAGVTAIVALALAFVGSDYAISFSIQLLIFLVLAYSWNWIGGYAGYSHFGQVGFFGIGAYVGSLLNFHLGVPWYLAAIVAAFAGAATAIPLGGAMLRLKGPFFAIGMFGLSRVLEAFALGFDSVTGGGTGIYLKPISDLRPLYLVVAAVALIMLLLTWKLDNSRLGLKLLRSARTRVPRKRSASPRHVSRSEHLSRRRSHRRQWDRCMRPIWGLSIRRPLLHPT